MSESHSEQSSTSTKLCPENPDTETGVSNTVTRKRTTRDEHSLGIVVTISEPRSEARLSTLTRLRVPDADGRHLACRWVLAEMSKGAHPKRIPATAESLRQPNKNKHVSEGGSAQAKKEPRRMRARSKQCDSICTRMGGHEQPNACPRTSAASTPDSRTYGETTDTACV